MEEALTNFISDEFLLLIKFGVVLIVSMWVKQLVDKVVQGFLFRYGDVYNQGDEVFIDGERAIIISIGHARTIFEIQNGRGKVWRYVDNDKLKNCKFEKIIVPRERQEMMRRRSSDQEKQNNEKNTNINNINLE